MPLIAGSDQASTPFTPAAGVFIVQVVGRAQLERENASGVGFVAVLNGLLQNVSVEVNNTVAGARYRWVDVLQGSTFRADQ